MGERLLVSNARSIAGGVADARGAVSASTAGVAPTAGAARSVDHRGEPLRCPRCDSANTKFCYYNNYSLAQPRHFCKACKRYWTRGGTLRNVPVGGGCRKNKKSKKRPSNSGAAASPSTLPPLPLSNPFLYSSPDFGNLPVAGFAPPASNLGLCDYRLMAGVDYSLDLGSTLLSGAGSGIKHPKTMDELLAMLPVTASSDISGVDFGGSNKLGADGGGDGSTRKMSTNYADPYQEEAPLLMNPFIVNAADHGINPSSSSPAYWTSATMNAAGWPESSNFGSSIAPLF